MGLGILLVVAILTLTASFLYLGPFLAIIAFLLFGLAVPIYTGWKQPRVLAVFGLVALLVAGPMISVLYVDTVVRVPSPSADSAASLPYGNGGPVLQGAQVAPFTSDGDGPFHFSVTVNPQFVPANATALLWLVLYVSTCPGATGNNSPYCQSGYPFYTFNQTLANVTATTVETFDVHLPAPNVWWWQMATAYATGTNHSLVWIFLAPANSYAGVQGPISGDFTSTLSLILVPVYLDVLIYPGLLFYIGLLVYVFLKRRQARRFGGPTAPGSPEPAAAAPGEAPGPAASPSAEERACPNCQAVVYPGETACWKCGKPLEGAPGKAAPLPSGPSPPSPKA